MISEHCKSTPQAFLDLVEKLLTKRGVIYYRYLVEYDKPTVDRSPGRIDIQVQDVVATPVRALRWDYLIGYSSINSSINSRQFIIADRRYAEYFIDLDLLESHKHYSSGRLSVKLSKFEEGTVAPHLIKKYHLEESRLEEKLQLKISFPSLEAEVIINKTGNDEVFGDLLKELEKTSKK